MNINSSSNISTSTVMSSENDSVDSARTQDTVTFISECIKITKLRRPDGVSGARWRKQLKDEKMAAGTWTEQRPKTRAQGAPQMMVDKDVNKKRQPVDSTAT